MSSSNNSPIVLKKKLRVVSSVVEREEEDDKKMSSNITPIIRKKKLRIVPAVVEREEEDDDFEDCVFEEPLPPPSVATMVAFKTNRVKSCCGSADKNEVRTWCRDKYGKTWFKRGDKKTIMKEAKNAICKTKIAE